MVEDTEEQTDTNLLGELSELGAAIRPLLHRLPRAAAAIDKLTGGLVGAGTKALASRLHRYRTENLVNEAQQVAEATGLPVPVVLDKLVRQRRIDELMIDTLRRVGDSIAVQNEAAANVEETSNNNISDRWFHTFYEEASTVDEEEVREAFVRILAGEIRFPGSFSLRTLRAMSAMNRSTAQHFRRVASVSIRLTSDGKHIMDARIPAVGGDLGQNSLQDEGLSYGVLIDMTENGLVHPDYSCSHPYGPLEQLFDAQQPHRPVPQIPFTHQGATWMLIPMTDQKKAKSMQVKGARLTSCGVELLKIVDIESLPSFTDKLMDHFSQSRYQMVRSP